MRSLIIFERARAAGGADLSVHCFCTLHYHVERVYGCPAGALVRTTLPLSVQSRSVSELHVLLCCPAIAMSSEGVLRSRQDRSSGRHLTSSRPASAAQARRERQPALSCTCLLPIFSPTLSPPQHQVCPLTCKPLLSPREIHENRRIREVKVK